MRQACSKSLLLASFGIHSASMPFIPCFAASAERSKTLKLIIFAHCLSSRPHLCKA